MKQLNKILICFLAMAFIHASGFSQNQVVIKDSAFKFSDILGPRQIPFPVKNGSFSWQGDRVFNFGIITNKYCYIVIKVQADSVTNSFALSIDNTSLDTVLMYKLSLDGSKTLLYKGGNLVRYNAERLYVWHTIPLSLSPEPQYYFIALKAASKNINVEYKILKQTALQKLYNSYDKLIYFYLGIILLIIFICLIGLVLFKNNAISLYISYIVAVTAWVLAHYGYLFPMLYPSHPRLNEVIKPVLCLLATNAFLNLITYLFQEEFKNSRISIIYTILKFVICTFILLSLTYLLFPFSPHKYTYFNIGWNVMIVLSICLVMSTLSWLFRRNRTARIFLIAVCVLSLMVLLQIFSLTGYIHSPFLNDHGILIASCLEILILTFGIFYDVWEDKVKTSLRLKLLEEKQKEALQMLIHVQDNERKRIAADLHDSIGPMLAAIKINFLRLIKTRADPAAIEILVAKTENIIDESITEIRSISHQLMPKNLESKGLITSLSDYYNDLQTIYGTCISFTHEIKTTLDKDVQLNLYKIMCELGLNAARHSGAKVITALLKALQSEISIMIHDNGRGFSTLPEGSTSLGINNVKNRVAYLKGTMNIESSAGEGTSIQILIPAP